MKIGEIPLCVAFFEWVWTRDVELIDATLGSDGIFGYGP